MFKSTNGGAAWSVVNTGLTYTAVHALVIDPNSPSTLYAGTGGGGVFKSTNGGAAWSAFNTGLTDPVVGDLAIDPATSTLYAGTHGYGGGVYKSWTGGLLWSTDQHRPARAALCLLPGD